MTEKRKANRYAVVDLEATNSGSHAKIIQIGIVILEAGRIVQQYETDVNPHEKLDHHIRELTGITDEQLRRAPDFGQVAEEIFDLLEDAIFVAHNVSFDANLLAEALFFEGYELRSPRVDTVELAQLFFPTFEKYGLGNLAEHLQLDLDQAHTAISDARATAQLLVKIQDKIRQLPKQTVERMLPLADNLLYESRLVIDELYPDLDSYLPEHLVEVHGLVLRKKDHLVEPYHLSEDFQTNLALLGLDERQEQAAFAQIVAERLRDEERSVHFIEAQAGIGKTYGYLLPLLAKTQQPLVMVVPTKILQEQIMENEGKRLAEVFHISITSIKAPRHYLNLDRFLKSLERQDDNRLLNRYKMQVLVWLCETKTGDMDELKQKQRYQSYFDELQHDGLLKEESLFFEWDFWARAQENARKSRVVLTNHAYFLHHVADSNLIHQEKILVIDEAQKLALMAEELASQSLDMMECLQLIQSKKDKCQSVLEQRLLEDTAFEINHLLQQSRLSGQKMVVSSALEQLRRNLLELDDPDFSDWYQVLASYDDFWIEERRFGDGRVSFLRASQEELVQVAHLLPQTKTFCVSATLTISQKVQLADLLGFQEVTMDKLPSQKRENQLLYVPEDLPNLMEWSYTDHARFIVRELEKLVTLGKPILVLFTSIRLLLEVSTLLEEAGLAHLAQHRHGPEDSLKKRFDKGEAALLLGTGLFWEGVDFAHQEQMIQVITRLPFENPQDRFVRKINAHLKEQGKNPFYDYHLPMMLLKLKQAIGRSSRSRQQQSVVVLLDDRIISKQYGKQIWRFLEQESQLKGVSVAGLTQEIDRFFTQES